VTIGNFVQTETGGYAMKPAFLSVMAAVLLLAAPVTALADAAAVKTACSADKSPTLKAIYDRGELRWALGISPPYGAKDSQGNFIGTEADNARAFAELLGVKVEIKDYTYNLLPPTIASGLADVVGASLYVTDARKQVIDFSDVYHHEGSVFVVLASRNDLNSIDDLNKAGIKVEANLGSGFVDLAKKVLPNATVIQADESTSPGSMFIISGQDDVTVTDGTELPLEYKAAGNVKLKVIGKKGVVAGDLPNDDDLIEPFDVAFGVRKGDPGFLACVNAFVAYGLENGSFRASYEKWVKTLAR
jgi:ABC-type amino acid transport substrate-binding protein